MAQHRRRSDGRPGDSPRSRKRSGPGRPRTNLAAFLKHPLGRLDDDAFATLCRRMLEVLAPRDGSEQVLADSIIQEFGCIRRARRALELGVQGAERYNKSATASFRSLQRTYDLFRQIMTMDEEPARPSAESPAPPPPTSTSTSSPAAMASERVASPEPDEPGPDPEVEELEAAYCDWRSRIAMVPHVDARWPVLDRLGLPVDDVLSLRDRGGTEEEVLDRFDGLTFHDLAACYACEADGYRGPLEPPYPDDLAVIDRGPGDD